VKKIKILLIEDDELAASMLSEFLEECNFHVHSVFTAVDGISNMEVHDFDILLLDISLPDFSGFEVLKGIKDKISIPVIVTSAYSDTASKLKAFRFGASDYMVKPYDLEELEARIWVQLSKTSKIKLCDKCKIFEIKESSIVFKSKTISLTPIEYKILKYFIENKNIVINRDDLYELLDSSKSARSLDNHIKNIRKKIGDSSKNPHYIKSVYGVGYILNY